MAEKIVTVNGFEKENNNIEGVYREITYIVDIDAETGMRLSYDAYSEGEKIYSYKMTNYKFNDEAVEFRTALDIISEVENGGYTNV